jgi:hypothetical protein
MSDAKPTTGPYRIESHIPGVVRVYSGYSIIASFRDVPYGSGQEGHAQAEANARAWVEGMAAIEKLERIRECFYSGESLGAVLRGVGEILQEAKP